MFGRKPREPRDKNRPCALCPAVVPESQLLPISRGKTTYFIEWGHIENLLLDPRVHARLVRLWPEMQPGLRERMPQWFTPPASRAEVDLAPLQATIRQAGEDLAPTLEKIWGALEALRAGIAEVGRLAAAPPSREQMDVIRGMLDATLGREDKPGVLRHMEILEGQDALLAELNSLRRIVENGNGRAPVAPAGFRSLDERMSPAAPVVSPPPAAGGFQPIAIESTPPVDVPPEVPQPPPTPPAEKPSTKASKALNPNVPLGPRGWSAVEEMLRTAGAPGLTYTQMVLRGLDPEDLRRTLTNYRERLESLRAGGHILYSLRDNNGDKGDNGTAPSPRRGAAGGPPRRGRG